MTRLLEGRSLQIPVVTTVDDTTVGADLLGLADRTASFSHVRPRTVVLYVNLTGTTGTLKLRCYVKLTITPGPIALGWALLHDTRNPGVLGGQALGPGQYVFTIAIATIFDQFVLLLTDQSGDVAVATSNGAVMIEVAENVQR